MVKAVQGSEIKRAVACTLKSHFVNVQSENLWSSPFWNCLGGLQGVFSRILAEAFESI